VRRPSRAPRRRVCRPAPQLDSPLFFDARNAFAFAIVWDKSTLKQSVLERTSDGGATWHATPMSPAIHGDLTFFDSNHGWLVSAQDSADHLSTTETLWRTSDGGMTWSSTYSYAYRLDVHPSTQPGGCYWQGSIAWSSATNGIVGVSCPFDSPPAVDVTRDGGSTWVREALPPLAGPNGISLYSITGPVHIFANGEELALVSRCVGPDGTSCTPYAELYRTHDGGASWSQGEMFRGGALGLLTSDWAHAWMSDGCLDPCLSFGMLRTADGGVHWQVLPLRTELQPNMHGSRIYSFVTPDLGFVTSSNEFQQRTSYYRTNDAGRTFMAFQPLLEA